MGHIETSQTTGIYVFLYSLIFIAAYLWLIRTGNKKSIPTLPWMVAIGMCFIGFSIGCNVIMMTTTEWSGLLHGSLPEIQGRSVIGGLLGALTGIIIGNYLFKIPQKVIDQYALLLPLGIAVMRIGCLLSGCCYGTTTSVPWAITYGVKSAAYTNHTVHELISQSKTISLPVHPVQLYEIAGCILIFFILWRNHARLKASFSLILLSGSLYGAWRFITEFFRGDSNSTNSFINSVQVFLLMLVPLLLLIVYLNEKNFKHSQRGKIKSVTTLRIFVTLSALTLFAMLSSVLLNGLDFFVINLSLLPAWVFLLIKVYQQSPIFLKQPVVTLVFIGALFSMAQTDSTLYRNNKRASYNTINLGFFYGNHDLTDQYFYNTDCAGSGQTIDTRVTETYKAGGGGFAHTIVKDEFKKITWGLNGTIGQLTETGSGNLTTERKLTYYDIDPFLKYDTKAVGIGGGIHVGDLPILDNTYTQGDVTLITRYRVYPHFNFRLGRLDKFFGELRYADSSYGTFPASLLNISFGTGFGNINKHSLRVGTSSFSAIVIEPQFALGDHYFIQPYLGAGESLFGKFASESNFQTGFKFSYQY